MGGGMRSVPANQPAVYHSWPRARRGICRPGWSAFHAPDPEEGLILPAGGRETANSRDVAKVNSQSPRSEGTQEAGHGQGADVALATGHVACSGRS